MSTTWNTDRIFELAGGASRMRRLLEKHGYDELPTINTIVNWRARGGISKDWMPPVVACLVEEGLITRAADLLREEAPI